MKHLLFILCLIIGGLLILMDMVYPEPDHVVIETEGYRLALPRGWEVTRGRGSTLTFYRDGEEIGGSYILGYYPEHGGVSALDPNHSEALSRTRLDGLSREGYLVHLEETPPAASHEDWVRYVTYVYLLSPATNRAYVLWFYSGDVDDVEAVSIAKTLVLR